MAVTPRSLMVTSPVTAREVGTPVLEPTRIFPEARVANLLNAIAAAASTSALTIREELTAPEELLCNTPAVDKLGIVSVCNSAEVLISSVEPTMSVKVPAAGVDPPIVELLIVPPLIVGLVSVLLVKDWVAAVRTMFWVSPVAATSGTFTVTVLPAVVWVAERSFTCFPPASLKAKSTNSLILPKIFIL
jgi:hypothetical protein